MAEINNMEQDYMRAVREVNMRGKTIERLRDQIRTRDRIISLRDAMISYHEYEIKRITRRSRIMFWLLAMSIVMTIIRAFL